MKALLREIESFKQDFHDALEAVQTQDKLQALRIAMLGRQGSFTALMAQLKELSPEDKRIFGPRLNELKATINNSLKAKEEEFLAAAAAAEEAKKSNFDLTAYKTGTIIGHLHPYTHITQEIEEIFLSMGYEVVAGNEVDSEYYNFTALNIPEDHPARDMYDTFWLTKPGMLLRTHTSTMQVRSMETKELPIAVVAAGRCFRHEATDASHDFMFQQCEGFLIDKNITLAHLFGTARTFLQRLFGKELEIRIRPGFFPFVEPGVEIDVQCPFCSGGCSVCKKSTWIEVFPGGLIHRNVLKAGGIDPDIYSGFAFGFGLTRLTMIKYNIRDIRLLHGSNMKFLDQF